MAAITTLRGTLATALTNNGVWSTFSFPPATLLANSVVVTPGDPYITPNNNSQTSIAPLGLPVANLCPFWNAILNPII